MLLSKLSSLLVCSLLAVHGGTTVTTQTPPPTASVNLFPSINGLYSVGEAGRTTPESILASPNVDGIAVRANWEAIEPAQGTYDWSYLDQEIAAAATHGKKVSLSIQAGFVSPNWVYTSGASAFQFVWNKSWGPASCSQQKIPLPWDPVFLAQWETFVRALGHRYEANPTVRLIKLTGINAVTEETGLPQDVNAAITDRTVSCKSGDDLSNWQQAGYTSSKIEAAFQAIADTFASAFPAKRFAVMLSPHAFPPIDENGHLSAKIAVEETLLSSAIDHYGDQFVVQNNGLSASWSWQQVAADATQVNTGYQMLWAATGDATCRMNQSISPCDPATVLQAALERGLKAGGRYIEVYRVDILNPSLQSILANAHRSLL